MASPITDMDLVMSRIPAGVVRSPGRIHTSSNFPRAVATTGSGIVWRKLAKIEETDMAGITREEHEAKLEAVEARVEGRIGKIEVLLESVSNGIARIEAASIRETDRLENSLSETKNQIAESRRHTTNVAWAVFGACVAVVALAAAVYQTGLTGRQIVGAPAPITVPAMPNSNQVTPPAPAAVSPVAPETKALPAPAPTASSDKPQ